MGKKRKSSSTTTTSLAPEQRKLLAATTPIFEDYLAQGGAKLPGYSSVAGVDPAQTYGQNLLLGAALGGGGGVQPGLHSVSGAPWQQSSSGGSSRGGGRQGRGTPLQQVGRRTGQGNVGPRIPLRPGGGKGGVRPAFAGVSGAPWQNQRQAGGGVGGPAAPIAGSIPEVAGNLRQTQAFDQSLQNQGFIQGSTLGSGAVQAGRIADPGLLARIAPARELSAAPTQDRIAAIQGLSLDPNEANPYISQYAEAAVRPFVRDLQERILPGLEQRSVAGGTFGGSRGRRAQALAAERTAQAGADAISGIYKDAYDRNLSALLAQRGQDVGQRSQDLQTALGARGQDATYFATTRGQDVTQRGQDTTAQTARRGQDVAQRGQDITARTARRGQDLQNYLGRLNAASAAAGRATDLAGAQTRTALLPGIITGQVGAQRQAQAQRELTDRYQRDLYAQRAPFLAAQDVANIALGGPRTTTTTQTQPGPDFLQTAVGLGSLGVAAFSDRRLKTDIRRVGKLFSGLPVYSFRWKETGEAAFGVLADEVAEVMPEAVSQSPDGYLLVNYGKLAA